MSTHKDGRDRAGKQRYRCSACQRSSTDRTGTPFTNHRWPRDVIVMAVRWYFSYRLSAANIRNLLAERGLDVSRQTVADWVQKFGVLLAEAGRRYAKRVGSRWYVDETYLWVGKKWAYLYRAVDEDGQVVDVLLREKRDRKSAEAFFERAIKRRGVVPGEVVTDKHRAYLQAVKQHAPNAKHRRTGLHRKRALTTKPVERSHVPVKDRVRAMRSLGSVPTGRRLLEGIELAQAVQRGDICLPNQPALNSVHERARLAVTTFSRLASGLRTAAWAAQGIKLDASAFQNSPYPSTTLQSLQAGRHVDWAHQKEPNALFAQNSKWRVALSKVNSFDDRNALQKAVGNALAAKWNDEHPPSEEVSELTVYNGVNPKDRTRGQVTSNLEC